MDENLEEIVTAGLAQAAVDLDGKLAIDPDATPSEEAKEAEVAKDEAEPKVPDVPKVPATEELDDLGLTKQQQVEARQLFAALKDPTKSPAIIRFLADNAGITKTPETKTEVKVAALGMVDELKEALGPELAYLAEKMGPVFEKHLKTQTEESIKPLKTKMDENDLQALKNEGDRVQAFLADKYFGAKELPIDVVKKATEVMNTYNANPGQSMADYLENVLFIASGKLGLQLKVGGPQQKQTQGKIDKSRSNAPGNLEGRPRPAPGERSVHPSRQQALSLEDSISQALTQAREQLTK